MIEIQSYETRHQDDINVMMKEIASEFEFPISRNHSNSIQSLDGYWVALYKSVVVGTIGVIIQNDYAILKNMFVKNEYRGMQFGIANLLLNFVSEYCCKFSINKIYLGTMDQFKAAHKFYNKNGFKRISESYLPSDFIANPLDDRYYLKWLDSKETKWIYRIGELDDLEGIKALAIDSWKEYKESLTENNWLQLEEAITNENNFINLLQNSDAFICETKNNKIIGIAFLVPRGNPTEIYKTDWSYIRFVSVHPLYLSLIHI